MLSPGILLLTGSSTLCCLLETDSDLFKLSSSLTIFSYTDHKRANREEHLWRRSESKAEKHYMASQCIRKLHQMRHQV